MTTLYIRDDRIREQADDDERDRAKQQPASRDDDKKDQNAGHVEFDSVEPAPMAECPARAIQDRGPGGGEDEQCQDQALGEGAQHAGVRQVAERQQQSVDGMGHARRNGAGWGVSSSAALALARLAA